MKQNKTILRLKDKVSPELYTLLTTGRVLQLTLKREWYLKIACGEKKEEYRTINEYWKKRFTHICKRCDGWCDDGSCECGGYCDETGYHFGECFNEYDLVLLKNGYGKDSPITIVESKGLERKQGLEIWGAVAKQFYYTHKLGNVLYSEPCS